MAKIYGVEDKKISENFWLSEFLRSRQADASKIVNKPNIEQISTINWVSKNVAQPLRDAIGDALNITSGFRGPKLNKLVGGVEDSYHTYKDGYFAFDCHAPSLSLIALLEKLSALSLPITKAIIELDQGVLHIQGIKPQYLVRDVIDGKKIYAFYDDYKISGRIS